MTLNLSALELPSAADAKYSVIGPEFYGNCGESRFIGFLVNKNVDFDPFPCVFAGEFRITVFSIDFLVSNYNVLLSVTSFYMKRQD